MTSETYAAVLIGMDSYGSGEQLIMTMPDSGEPPVELFTDGDGVRFYWERHGQAIGDLYTYVFRDAVQLPQID